MSADGDGAPDLPSRRPAPMQELRLPRRRIRLVPAERPEPDGEPEPTPTEPAPTEAAATYIPSEPSTLPSSDIEPDEPNYEPLEARMRVYQAAHEEARPSTLHPNQMGSCAAPAHMTVVGTNFGGSRRSRVSWAVELARAAHINLVVESIDANVAEDLRHMGWECVSNMWEAQQWLGGPNMLTLCGSAGFRPLAVVAAGESARK